MNKGTNRGEAAAFKLDALLKLADIKSADNRTTLLHFVVGQTIKAEGLRAFRGGMASLERSGTQVQMSKEELKRKGLEVVLGLCTELDIVKKAAGIDLDALNQSVEKLACGLSKLQERLKTGFQAQLPSSKAIFETPDSFVAIMEHFCLEVEGDMKQCKQELNWVHDKVNRVAVYFHGNLKEAQPLSLFIIVSDFLYMLEKVCRDLSEPLKVMLHG